MSFRAEILVVHDEEDAPCAVELGRIVKAHTFVRQPCGTLLESRTGFSGVLRNCVHQVRWEDPKSVVVLYRDDNDLLEWHLVALGIPDRP